ncbi:MAG: [FeFe] hydrogenase H-cluster radical SAM maturase HydE [Lachnospiraceae bacterium]|nr:[FeFe] hydrogenase H-cluster radical SAM maturase HydE [Lachnospiraceae bacterium]
MTKHKKNTEFNSQSYPYEYLPKNQQEPICLYDAFCAGYDKLLHRQPLNKEEFTALLDNNTNALREQLSAAADEAKRKYFGSKVYIRGLIEFSNYCKNDCYYCGIRHSNQSADRYRLSKEDILLCCREGYELGFRTFVLQSGEDPFYTDDHMIDIISSIHKMYPDCAITLSLGERSKESYKRLFDAGANRYLLRHETANKAHYNLLHPASMSYEHRMQCLQDLKDIGYQVGCGFMVGSPHQTSEMLANDLLFIQDFKPHMVGIGPFISHKDTPFAEETNGTLEDTLLLLSILRLMQPALLLPATTALGTISPTGREQGIQAGANVVMPNLSPTKTRAKYSLYDNKICTGDEAAECIHCMDMRMKRIGHEILVDRGDSPLIPIA